LRLYNKLLSGLTIESQLRKHMTEHINAECVGGGIHNEQACVRWMKETFMYTRMKIKAQFTLSRIDQMMVDESRRQIGDLANARMIEYEGGMRDPEDEHHLQQFYSTGLGELMCRSYLSFNTVKLFTQITATTTFEDFLVLFSESNEFGESEMRIRVSATA
jgi:replicative superfamily II helicase